MRETKLISFTKADDSGCGTRDPGDLDYIIHASDAERWLSNGSVENGEDVAVRSKELATEMRTMADHLERGDGPFAVTVEFARKRYADRVRKLMPKMNRP